MRKKLTIFLCTFILSIISGCNDTLEEETNNEINSQNIVESNEKGTTKESSITQLDTLQFYVPSEKDNIISIIDFESNTVIGEIKTGDRPANVSFVNKSQKAFVTHRNGNSVGVIDLSDQKMMKEIEVGKDPHGLALSADQSNLYVTTVGDQYVFVIDTDKEVVKKKIDIGKGAKTNYPYLHGNRLYVTDHENRLVYVIEEDRVIEKYKVSGPPMVARTSSDGTLLYVASSNYNALEVFDTKSGKKIGEIYSGKDVTDFVINNTESILVATNKDENSVSIIDLKTREIKKKIKNLAAPKHISFNFDETKVYFTLSGTNKVASIDLQSLELVGEIVVGSTPHGIELKDK